MTADTIPNDPRAPLVGTWKLISNYLENKNGERRYPQGENPNGYAIFTREGRMLALFTGGGNEPPKSNEECASLFKNMVGYTGIFRVEGDRFITKVDMSWCRWWNGTEHARTFKIEGNRLEIVSAWEPIRAVLGSPLVRGTAVWERAV